MNRNEFRKELHAALPAFRWRVDRHRDEAGSLTATGVLPGPRQTISGRRKAVWARCYFDVSTDLFHLSFFRGQPGEMGRAVVENALDFNVRDAVVCALEWLDDKARSAQLLATAVRRAAEVPR